ncbi:hypothetical protein GWR56_06325 [Mucilaginibacter sp. 14171R-50]|uniref:hypothetical protein n=1 Tax=Mucilaginibacter sp. 14171R-50 TaxID=2703789 RepID=UPI00138B8A5B|nr:hypothetical protein [Mucilaginibacter sp. 14171R-50]QHS55173.1 hypothetical protein GWR56_06325 [Mucilaginibacter sp. 14171R-50]
MKKTFFLSAAAILLSAPAIFAQATANQTTSPFIFPEFKTGTVFQKGGATVEASLDYNTVTQEMMFDQNGSKLILDDVSNIDSIVIQNFVFVPANKVFYEKLTKTPVSLFAQYKGKAVKASADEIGVGGAIGGTIGVTKKDNQKPGSYDMQLKKGYKINNQVVYWLKKGNDFIQVNNLKSLDKIFPGKENQIDAFIKENHTSIYNIADMIKLIEFSNK